jgi:hypothetical protein
MCGHHVYIFIPDKNFTSLELYTVLTSITTQNFRNQYVSSLLEELFQVSSKVEINSAFLLDLNLLEQFEKYELLLDFPFYRKYESGYSFFAGVIEKQTEML